MKERNNLKTILVSATVTGLFTFLTTLLIDHFTTKKRRLVYDTQTSMPFQKDSLNVRIHNLDLLNDGDEVIETIEGLVDFRDQTVTSYQVKGSPVLSMYDSLREHHYHLKLGSLNPGEKLTITFLVSGTARVDSLPTISFRARGISGEEKKDAGRGNGMPLYKVLLLAIFLAIVLSSTVIMIGRKKFRASLVTNTNNP